MSKMAYKIVCKLCGNTHISTSKHTKVCKGCRGKWCVMNRKGAVDIKKECIVCGKEFIIHGAINADKKCCSPKCGRIESWRNGSRPSGKTVAKECKFCGKKFDRLLSAERVTIVTHCSRRCYGLSKRKEGTYTELNCAKCGIEFQKRTTHLTTKNYCSKKCSNDARKIEGALWRDKDYMSAYHRNYSHINREKLLEGQRIRRSQKANTENRLKPKEWREILDKYNHTCLKCGTKEKITIDHVIPLSKEGTHTKDNVQPLCKSCNSSKSVKIIDYRPKEVYDKDF